MTQPESSTVSAGQDILAAQYNDLRKDALRHLGQLAAEETLNSSGTLTVTAEFSLYPVDTYADAASDSLVAISGGEVGQVITLFAANSAREVIVEHGAGWILLNDEGVVYLDNANSTSITLIKIEDPNLWMEVCRGGDGLASISVFFDGGGGVLTVDKKVAVRVPFRCYIWGNAVGLDQSGSIQVDVWNDTHANYPPTIADTIVASAPIVVTTDTDSEDTTLTGWIRILEKGSWLIFNIDSITSAEWASIELLVGKI